MLKIITLRSLKLRKNCVEGITLTRRPRPKRRKAEMSTKLTESDTRSTIPSMIAKKTRIRSMTFHLKLAFSRSKKVLRPSTHSRKLSSMTKIAVQARSTTTQAVGTASFTPGAFIRASALAEMVKTFATMLMQIIISNQREWTILSRQASMLFPVSSCRLREWLCSPCPCSFRAIDTMASLASASSRCASSLAKCFVSVVCPPPDPSEDTRCVRLGSVGNQDVLCSPEAAAEAVAEAAPSEPVPCACTRAAPRAAPGPVSSSSPSSWMVGTLKLTWRVAACTGCEDSEVAPSAAESPPPASSLEAGDLT
mmetsp:Transcript_31130/g.72477  ORF Transcript_31130/g.72477 Transcript_31130/m.72477 type:complete len:309 (+) Transcript_31130:1208-2134(+)